VAGITLNKLKVKKRHLLVDTLGLLMVVVVTAASVQDRDGAKTVLEQVKWRFATLQRVWADAAYGGQLIGWIWQKCRLVLQIIRRTDNVKGFKVQPRRWVVERSFGWLNRYRRLAKDYERVTGSSEAMVQIAMLRLMLARLDRKERVRQNRLRQQQSANASRAGFALAD
jgi:putative transposase